MRTVDADELLKSVRESAKRAEEWLADCKAYHSAMTARAEQEILTFNECALRIKNAPTVDAVPVVRCKDCMHYGFTDNRIPEEQEWWCYFWADVKSPDAYCSDGERKGGDEYEVD